MDSTGPDADRQQSPGLHPMNTMQRPLSIAPDLPRVQQRTAPGILWMRRIIRVLYVLFSIEMGIMLILLPWKGAWTDNSLVLGYPRIRLWLNQDFTRGAVSGLGLLNLWIGIWEASHFARRQPSQSQ